MAPIHDTDIAEERWSKAEWRHFELWERIEIRLKRRKWLWITGTVVLFLALSSVPIVVDRWPKWVATRLTRALAQEINEIQREAAIEHLAYRIHFEGAGSLAYVIERGPSCKELDANPASVETVRKGFLGRSQSSGSGPGGSGPGGPGPGPESSFALLSTEAGGALGIPGLIDRYCYDPLEGSQYAVGPDPESVLVGFAITPLRDVADHRTDRISILLLRGPSAESSFD